MLKMFIFSLLIITTNAAIMPVCFSDDNCGYKSDGNYHCGTDCGYKSDGNYHCGTDCGYKSDGQFHCVGDG